MLTDTKAGSMRLALQQIYVNCYVEYVVKNPLSPAEHPRGIGVNNELFEASLEQFVVRSMSWKGSHMHKSADDCTRIESLMHLEIHLRC